MWGSLGGVWGIRAVSIRIRGTLFLSFVEHRVVQSHWSVASEKRWRTRGISPMTTTTCLSCMLLLVSLLQPRFGPAVLQSFMLFKTFFTTEVSLLYRKGRNNDIHRKSPLRVPSSPQLPATGRFSPSAVFIYSSFLFWCPCRFLAIS